MLSNQVVKFATGCDTGQPVSVAECSQLLDADATGYLRKVLLADHDPLGPVFDKKIASNGVASELLTGVRSETVIARGIHPHVFIKQ